MAPAGAPQQLAGVGWRHAHERALLEGQPALPFIEVHSENFFAEGGAARALLTQARQRYAVSLHGVGLALGSAIGVDEWHLDRLTALVQQIEPVRISDHASFARAPRHSGAAPIHGSDLLPIAFTSASLDLMVANVQCVQDRLQRPIGVENLSAYLAWADDAWAPAEFLNALADRSGCWLLLDVNNLVVNALNDAAGDPVASACAFVDRLDSRHIGEIHLAGHDASGPLVIDDHGSRVADSVWRVYRHAIQRHGARPTLVEWDTALPSFEVLLEEAAQADRTAHAVLEAALQERVVA